MKEYAEGGSQYLNLLEDLRVSLEQDEGDHSKSARLARKLGNATGVDIVEALENRDDVAGALEFVEEERYKV